MLTSMTQNICVGVCTIGTQNRIMAPAICSRPYSFSALIQRSAMTPVTAGMNSAAMPIVEKIAPKPTPDQCLFWNQYAPIVSSHEPQMKNWRKFITIRRRFRLMGVARSFESPQRNDGGVAVQGGTRFAVIRLDPAGLSPAGLGA